MKKNNNKRTLILSLISILVCLTMLIGSTFAWFTDTASTAVNKIESGTLDIVLEYLKPSETEGGEATWENAEGQTLAWNRNCTNGKGLWEPGCTYTLPAIRVRNNGNLSLKYKIYINGVQGDDKLLEAIDWSIKIGEEDFPLEGYEGVLYPAEPSPSMPEGGDSQSKEITISGHMREDAGNEYQDLSIDGIGITVVATQYAWECDSYGHEYDAQAGYPAGTSGILATLLANGGNVALTENIEVSAPNEVPDGAIHLVPVMSITKDTTLDLQGKSLTFASVGEESLEDYPIFFMITEAVTVTINGPGKIDAELGDNGAYGININNKDAVLNITGGEFYGACTAIQVQQGTLNISGGFFDLSATQKAQDPNYAEYVINCIDRYFTDGTAKINITGGTFVNFDPSANPEGEGTSFVAEGYTVVSEVHEGETWYTVVPVTP